MIFEKAAEMFAALQEIEVSPALSQRYSEKAAAPVVELQTEEVERLEQKMPAAPQGGETACFFADW